MRENGIENIKIQNFKGFQEEKIFEINNNHVLIYGPNGSGKSSVYWALYTLFQSSLKPLPKIQKYFEATDDENLLNINQTGLTSYVKIKTKVGALEREFTLDNNGITGELANLRELNLASEFISHRLLINFYNFRNSKEINLFDVFDRDILPFVFGETHFKDKSLTLSLEEINNRLGVLTGRNWRKKDKIETIDLANYNREIVKLIEFINNNATKYLEDNFSPNDIKIKLSLIGVYRITSYYSERKTQYYISPPVFKLSIENKKANGTWAPVERPQSFLNEARLTKIGIAIRFCLLDKRPSVPLKILALDDMLISLDLDNRLNLIRTVLNLYSNDYQIFIFTHEKGFFNELKRNINDDLNNWKLYEFQTPQNQKIRFRNAKTELQKATSFLKSGDFENCALELRKLGEIIMKNYLVKKESEIFQSGRFVSFSQMLDEAKNIISQSILGQFQDNILELQLSPDEWNMVKSENFNAVKIDPLIPKNIKKKVFKARTSLFNTAEIIKLETVEALKIVAEVKKIKDRILNYGAHPTDDTLYESEMIEAIRLFEELQIILNKV